MQSSSPSARFRFGENWRSFVATITEESVLEAERGLLRLLPESAIRGRSFLDVGCGSGLSMLAALRLGAASVRGVDYDADSVEATRALLSVHAPAGAWSAIRKSVFDLTPDDDGRYDTVYSWGVLHHTGAVWRAIEDASKVVAPGVPSPSRFIERHQCVRYGRAKSAFMRTRLLRSNASFAFST